MPKIHLVERGLHPENIRLLNKANNEWESGYWVVSEATARRLIGGHIFLHAGQQAPSHFGGEILDFRVHASGGESDRVVFRFRADVECKGINAGRNGWGNEKKIVW
jgi:hypothetical protein